MCALHVLVQLILGLTFSVLVGLVYASAIIICACLLAVAVSWSIYFQIGLPVPFIGRRDHCLGTYSAQKTNNIISASSNLTVFILHFSDMDALMDT